MRCVFYSILFSFYLRKIKLYRVPVVVPRTVRE